MTTATTDSFIFPLFSNLAPELRDQIWRDALPDEVSPALYSYKEGCWSPRHLLPTDEEYDSTDHDLNLNFEFRHDLLCALEVEVPLFFVNHEARKIALAWIREHGIETHANMDRQSPIFVCPFNPSRDVLYVAREKWEDFLHEPDDRCFHPDLVDQMVTNIMANVTHIAISEILLRSEISYDLAYMLDRWYRRCKVLFIIVNSEPNLLIVETDMQARRRWELESVQKEAVFWNCKRDRFEFRDGKTIDDESLYKLLGEAKKGLGEEFVKNNVNSLEIQFVYAVRK